MIFKNSSKGRKPKNKIRFMWKNNELEVVKEFCYLGYNITENNKDEMHIIIQTTKARALLEKIWSIGEKLFKENWWKRMSLFKALIQSIAFYGVEVWGYKEHKRIEILQKKYVKWVLRLENSTPD